MKVRTQVGDPVVALQKEAQITPEPPATGVSFAAEICQRLAQHFDLLVSFNQPCRMCYLELL